MAMLAELIEEDKMATSLLQAAHAIEPLGKSSRFNAKSSAHVADVDGTF